MNSVVSIFTAHELSIMNGLYGTTLLTELTLHNGAQTLFWSCNCNFVQQQLPDKGNKA